MPQLADPIDGTHVWFRIFSSAMMLECYAVGEWLIEQKLKTDWKRGVQTCSVVTDCKGILGHIQVCNPPSSCTVKTGAWNHSSKGQFMQFFSSHNMSHILLNGKPGDRVEDRIVEMGHRDPGQSTLQLTEFKQTRILTGSWNNRIWYSKKFCKPSYNEASIQGTRCPLVSSWSRPLVFQDAEITL